MGYKRKIGWTTSRHSIPKEVPFRKPKDIKSKNSKKVKKGNPPMHSGRSGDRDIWWASFVPLCLVPLSLQSRSQSPRAFWSAPRHGALESTAVKWERMLKPRACDRAHAGVADLNFAVFVFFCRIYAFAAKHEDLCFYRSSCCRRSLELWGKISWWKSLLPKQ